MADLGLSDAMNAAEALFEAIGIPRQIVIDHEMRAALEVHTFASGVVRNHHANNRIRIECSDGRASSFASNAAMDHNNRCRLPYPRRNLLLQVFEGIFRLSEDDDLSPQSGGRVQH